MGGYGAKMKGHSEGQNTMVAVWPIIMWCFRVLLSGVWLARAWRRWERNRRPLAGGLLLAFIEVAADLGLRATSGWRASLVDSADWYLSEKHDLFNDPRVGLIFFHVQLDILHMGACASTSGAILFLFDCGLRGSFEERADVVWPALLKAYNKLGTPASAVARGSVHTMFEGCGRSWTAKEYSQLVSKATVARHTAPTLRFMRDLLDRAHAEP